MVRDIVTRWAPMLTIGEIDTSTFVCGHAAFVEPTTAEDAISRLNAFLLWDWLVYDNKTFHYRAPDPDLLTWRARRDRGARLSLAGDDAENQFNGVIVTYQDALGQKRITGPPATYWPSGVARADTTSTLLVDTAATNPVNAAGIPRRWGKLELSSPCTDAMAQQIGAVWLLEHARAQRRGEITLQGVGSVQHPTQGELPTWCVRGSRLHQRRRHQQRRPAPDHQHQLHAPRPHPHRPARQHRRQARRDPRTDRDRPHRRPLSPCLALDAIPNPRSYALVT
jgi:hypothetical protein